MNQGNKPFILELASSLMRTPAVAPPKINECPFEEEKVIQNKNKNKFKANLYLQTN